MAATQHHWSCNIICRLAWSPSSMLTEHDAPLQHQQTCNIIGVAAPSATSSWSQTPMMAARYAPLQHQLYTRCSIVVPMATHEKLHRITCGSRDASIRWSITTSAAAPLAPRVSPVVPVILEGPKRPCSAARELTMHLCIVGVALVSGLKQSTHRPIVRTDLAAVASARRPGHRHPLFASHTATTPMTLQQKMAPRSTLVCFDCHGDVTMTTCLFQRCCDGLP